MESTNDFSKGSVGGNITRLALPIILAEFINILYNVVDRIFIGRIPGAGTLALTGVGVCFPLITMLSGFAGLYGTGGAPLCSIARGRKDLKRASDLMGVSFFLLVVTSLVLTGITEVFLYPLVKAFGASAATLPYAAGYMRIYAAGTLFVCVSLGMNPFINSMGFGNVAMMTIAIGAVLNIVLDPLFIFTFGMGVEGAAWATVISQAASAFWIFKFLTGKKTILRLERSTVRFDAKLTKEICALGLTGFIVNFTNSSVQLVCNRMLAVFGGDLYIAIMTVINSIRTVISLPVTGISNGAQPVIGFNFGAGRNDRVKEAIRFQTWFSLIVTTAEWASVMLFSGPWIRLFTSDPDLLGKGIPAMRLYFLCFFMMTFQFAGQNTFTGLGKAKQAIFFSMFRKLIIVVPLTVILPRVGGLGVNGVFLAEPISDIVGGLACFLTMYFTVYRKLGDSDGEGGNGERRKNDGNSCDS